MTASQPPLYRFIVCDGPDQDRRLYLAGRRMVLATGPDGAIRIDDDGPGDRLTLEQAEDTVQLRADGAVTVNGRPVERAVLAPGDMIGLPGALLKVERVEPLPVFPARRRSSLQWVSAAVLGILLLLQVVILGLFTQIRPNALTLVAPSRAPEPSPPEEPLTPEERARLNRRLEEAGRRLRELEADRELQSVEELWDGTQSAMLAEEIGALQETVDDLGRRVESPLPDVEGNIDPDGSPDEASPTSPPEDSVRASRRLLTQARLDIAAGELVRADQVLQELQALDPDMVSSYVTRARLMERKGRLREAVAQWDEALKRTAGTPFYEEATAERTRLNREIRLRESRGSTTSARVEPEPVEAGAPASPSVPAPPAKRVASGDAAPDPIAQDRVAPDRDEEDRAAREEIAPAPPATDQPVEDAREPDRVAAVDSPSRPPSASPRAAPPSPPPAPPERKAFVAPPRLRIIDVQRERFQNRENYEEIRLVRVVLQPRKSAGALDPARVRTVVEFYDRDRDTSAIEISRVPTPNTGLALEGDWRDLGPRTLTALYMVREGFRDLERTTYGQRRRYYGYVVRVYYDGQLQDEYAFPSTLLSHRATARERRVAPGADSIMMGDSYAGERRLLR